MSVTRKVRPDASGPREADYYPTPAWAVEAVADVILASRPKDMPVIYEPCAGEGAILRALRARGAAPDHLRGCELRDDAAQLCRADGLTVWTMDFLEARPAVTSNIGVFPMNPPYGGRENTAQKFIMRALDLARYGASVWALLRINWLLDGEASCGRQTWMRNGPGTPNVHALNKRPSFTGDGKADATTYCWAHWVKGLPFVRPEFRIVDCHGAPAAPAEPVPPVAPTPDPRQVSIFDVLPAN